MDSRGSDMLRPDIAGFLFHRVSRKDIYGLMFGALSVYLWCFENCSGNPQTGGTCPTVVSTSETSPKVVVNKERRVRVFTRLAKDKNLSTSQG